MADNDAQELDRTPLYELHLELGARMVPFAGYQMPVQYPDGILKEHQHTRSAAGLFDVSHMGQIELHGANADAALETLTPTDVLGLEDGQQRYALLTTASGGVIDDLMVTRSGGHLTLVVNAACKQGDFEHLQSSIGAMCEVRPRPERGLLALQGPRAAEVMAALAPEAAALKFMHCASVSIDGVSCAVSRSGYTGEDGFEIAMAADAADRVARALLGHEAVAPIGLGARDSLRLEAGLCLYGHELATDITPVEAALRWALGKARRPGGARAGGYPGANTIETQLRDGTERVRVGLKPEGRAPVREGAELVREDGRDAGFVSSGGFGPTAGGPVAMGFVAADCRALGTRLRTVLRGREIAVEVASLPFAPHRYFRG